MFQIRLDFLSEYQEVNRQLIILNLDKSNPKFRLALLIHYISLNNRNNNMQVFQQHQLYQNNKLKINKMLRIIYKISKILMMMKKNV